MTAPILVGEIATRGPAADSLGTLVGAVRAAEAAGLDAVVLDDGAAPGGSAQGRFETTTLAAALAAATETIGLIVSPLPADQAPYHVARITASLDHLGHGRTGWLAGPADADGRTGELIEAVRGLWDSFDDDAFVHDRTDGLYWRLPAIHRLDHQGRHFDVAGPLNVARPPQGHPVVTVTDPALAGAADLVLLEDTDAARGTKQRAPHTKVLLPLPAAHGADEAAALLADSAADGFTVRLKGADDPVLATLAPLLRAGRPRHTTLRERLGLPRPASRHALTTV
ncbi:LLM class flavin-dependent oxidoreductase [Streptomyces sp. NPDC096176]|uniref:LLM class flavin-dependent oxidoreductase n=1 Tax=Streptomyces sp. NPDC096176 TaxID=3366079 RepID=UPI003829DCB3